MGHLPQIAFLAGTAAAAAGILIVRRTRRLSSIRPSLVHFTNDICPFSYRVVLAQALSPITPAAKMIRVPYKRQLDFAAKWSGDTWQHTQLGNDVLKRKGSPGDNFADSLPTAFASRAEALQALKDDYVATINPNGEVPALRLPSGAVLVGSEVCTEYFALAGTGRSPLVPDDPELACRMRQAMARFNQVTGLLFKLLTNQDPAGDDEIQTSIQSSLEHFVSVLDKSGGFCLGSRPTLADVHCAPILYRLDVGLTYWRRLSLRALNPRVDQILEAVTALPEWQSTNLMNDDDIVANYELPAHGNKWAADGLNFAGRGRS